MKKLYSAAANKTKHKKISTKKGKQNKQRRKYDPTRRPIYSNGQKEFKEGKTVIAPENLCLLDKTEDCLTFFKELRSQKNIFKENYQCYTRISLVNVKLIDYSTICVFRAIIEELRVKRIVIHGSLPVDQQCEKVIRESGLLTTFLDDAGKRFPKGVKSDFLFLEKGSHSLSATENVRISTTVQNIMLHLTNVKKHCPALRTILLEICGNTIEWSDAIHKQWILGVNYEENQVVITITDVGMGILNKLHRNFGKIISDLLTVKKNDEILKGAFIKKYGSTSTETNRNKGLPAIKGSFNDGLIKNLKVLTNNVILHFDDDINSRVLNDGTKFNGTFYRWVVTKDSLTKKRKI